MFAWNKTTSPQCSSIQYVISAIECGNCPNTTTDTNITCVHFSVSNRTCMFAVQTEICGYLVGPKSEHVIVNLFGKYNMHIQDPYRYLCGLPNINISFLVYIIINNFELLGGGSIIKVIIIAISCCNILLILMINFFLMDQFPDPPSSSCDCTIAIQLSTQPLKPCST